MSTAISKSNGLDIVFESMGTMYPLHADCLSGLGSDLSCNGKQGIIIFKLSFPNISISHFQPFDFVVRYDLYGNNFIDYII